VYRSFWYENDELWISTSNADGSPRTIDVMLDVLNTHYQNIRNRSPLHDWGGNAINGLTCRKCHSWCNTWHTPPKRGCNHSRTLTIVAPRLK
jgi:hypothetical protein